MGTRWVVAAVLMLAGCGGGQRSRDFNYTFRDETTMQTRNLQQGAMPPNMTWTGVYQSPEIGTIEVVQTGDTAQGRYEYDRGACHVVARLEGTITGNLLRFRWQEDHRVCGRIAPVIGHAYLLFWADDEGRRGRVDGEWGYGEQDRGGGHWGGFQLRDRRPSMLDNAPSGGGSDSSGGSSESSGSSGGSSSSN